MIRQTRLYKKIMAPIKKNQKLYALLKYTQNISNVEIQKLILANTLPREYCDSIAILAEHPGELYPDRVFYDLYMNPKTDGFFGLLRVELEMLDFADRLGLTPVVRWGTDVAYYDHEMDRITQNAYEYYFEQPSILGEIDVEKCRNVFRGNVKQHRGYFLRHATSKETYRLDENEIAIFAAIYRKHIRLNQKTHSYIDNELKKTLCATKTLGVHVRGTDFKKGILDHPNVIHPGEYLKKAREMFEAGDYGRVFLATDDLSALQLFKDVFGDKLVYYADTLRSDQNEGVHLIEIQRPLHHYKLGLEVLRDAYTLACCDGLLAGLSHVSFAARYINLSLNRHYENIVILNNGIKSVQNGHYVRGGLIRKTNSRLAARMAVAA